MYGLKCICIITISPIDNFAYQFHFTFFLKSFEGIEGTVDIATICGTTGPIIGIETRRESSTLTQSSTLKFGLIVQTISINANMPLPAAP